jgi:hypothetical protein
MLETSAAGAAYLAVVKNSGQCPKCGGQRIGYQPGGLLQGQNSMILGGGLFPSRARIGRFFCLDCGFSEEWIDDMDAIQVVEPMPPLVAPPPVGS